VDFNVALIALISGKSYGISIAAWAMLILAVSREMTLPVPEALLIVTGNDSGQ